MTSSRRSSLFGVKDDMKQETINNHYKKLVKLYNSQNKQRTRFKTYSFPSKYLETAVRNNSIVTWGEVEQEEGKRLYEEGGTSMTRLMMELLDIVREDTVVDLGAGNCRTGHQMTLMLQLVKPVLCVDPVQELLFLGSEFDHIRILQATALQFANMQEIRYNKIYLKSAIHHVQKDKLVELFNGLYKQLEQGGRILIETGSDSCLLPWFSKAVSEYSRIHSGLTQLLVTSLTKAGFKVQTYQIDIPARMSKKDLFSSFRQRCSSMFANLSDAEIEEGIKEVDGKWKENSIRYSHGRVLLLGRK